jgi:hypothetical protein
MERNFYLEMSLLVNFPGVLSEHPFCRLVWKDSIEALIVDAKAAIYT